MHHGEIHIEKRKTGREVINDKPHTPSLSAVVFLTAHTHTHTHKVEQNAFGALFLTQISRAHILAGRLHPNWQIDKFYHYLLCNVCSLTKRTFLENLVGLFCPVLSN